MRLRRCTFHNMGPFSDFTIDLEALGSDAKLVALVGRNGTGKSFTLEAAIAGAAYRKMPTNGALNKRATARDSWIESRINYGHDWTIRHVIDAVSGKCESVVTSNGASAYGDTKVSSFDAWAEKALPDEDVLFSSVFAAQQSEGFVKMTSAERIDVILSVIGVSRLERMAKAARDRHGKAAAELKSLVARIVEARGDTPAVETAEQILLIATVGAESADKALADARQALADAEAEDRRIAELVKTYEAAVQRRAELDTALESARKTDVDLGNRIANNKAVQDQGEAIRAARAELETLAQTDAALSLELSAVGKPFDAVASALAADLATQEQAVLMADSEVRASEAKLVAGGAAARTVADRIARARARLIDEDAVNGATAEAERIGSLVTEARTEVDAAEAALAQQRGQTQATDAGRIRYLRTGLELIQHVEAARLDEAPGMAGTVLANDDADVARLTEVPARISELEGRLSRARAELRRQEQALSAAERLAARAPEMAEARLELANATDAAAAAVRDVELLAERHGLAVGLLESERGKRAEINGRVEAERARRYQEETPAVQAILDKRSAVTLRRAELDPVAAKYDRLTAADARIAELEPQLATAQAEIARLVALVSATPAPDPPPSAPDVAAYKLAAAEAESKARTAHSAVAVATQRVADARAVDGRLALLEGERVALEADLSDWARLALDLGRTGLQSAEVDSAGPELTELINDLLHSCHSTRFTVSVDTQRLDSTGHKMLDECRIVVIDTVMGTEKEIREHSGGERALLGTAVSLALTMLACRRAGFDRPTIVRDESGANLDVDNAPAWIAMLRRAVEVTGADRLVFVDHRPEIIAMADAVIEIPSRTNETPARSGLLESAA